MITYIPKNGETDAREEACLGALRDYAKAPETIFHLLRIKTEERFCYYYNKLYNITRTVRPGIRHSAEFLHAAELLVIFRTEP
jgi:hypothetical protein